MSLPPWCLHFACQDLDVGLESLLGVFPQFRGEEPSCAEGPVNALHIVLLSSPIDSEVRLQLSSPCDLCRSLRVYYEFSTSCGLCTLRVCDPSVRPRRVKPFLFRKPGRGTQSRCCLRELAWAWFSAVISPGYGTVAPSCSVRFHALFIAGDAVPFFFARHSVLFSFFFFFFPFSGDGNSSSSSSAIKPRNCFRSPSAATNSPSRCH